MAAQWRRIMVIIMLNIITSVIITIMRTIVIIKMTIANHKSPVFCTGLLFYLQYSVIFPYRAENVYQFTIGNRDAAMPRV